VTSSATHGDLAHDGGLQSGDLRRGPAVDERLPLDRPVRDTDLIGNVDVVPAGFLGPAPPPRAAGAATANAVSPVVDPEDAGETMRRYFENASDGDLADDIRRAARQPQQVDR
jgi:hypothetical protein